MGLRAQGVGLRVRLGRSCVSGSDTYTATIRNTHEPESTLLPVEESELKRLRPHRWVV